jgi:hypothetical protein
MKAVWRSFVVWVVVGVEVVVRWLRELFDPDSGFESIRHHLIKR